VRKATFLTTLAFYDTLTFIKKAIDEKGGYEYSLILMIVSITIGLIGPGNYSQDTLLWINLPQAMLFSILAVAALLVDAIGILSSRKPSITTDGSVSKVS
jgi:hypothetical protein